MVDDGREPSTYERDLSIDESALDGEWLDHARRMFKYCELQAQAHRDLDLARDALSLKKAQLDMRARTSPEEFGVVAGSRGITEGAVMAAVLSHDEYRAANQAMIDAQYEYEVVQGVVRSFDHRKSALENLVRLHGQSYFAGPSVPHDLEEVRRQRDAQAQSTVGTRMRRRRV